jgi:hypothetical protein
VPAWQSIQSDIKTCVAVVVRDTVTRICITRLHQCVQLCDRSIHVTDLIGPVDALIDSDTVPWGLLRGDCKSGLTAFIRCL